MLAYYFFEFTSQDKSAVSNFLCSLLSQIVAQSPTTPVCLQALYHRHLQGTRKPNTKELLETLRTILADIQQAYIVVDGVDECNNPTGMVDVLDQITSWTLSGVHLMVTSRTDRVFAISMRTYKQIRLSGRQHRQDIRTYVEDRIQRESPWQKWPIERRQQIANDVVDKAEDMFRLAKLHLDALAKCTTPKSLRDTASVLPKDFYETYDRVIEGVAPEHVKHVERILGWLCFALRPPTLPELSAAIAVDLDALEYDRDEEYGQASDMLGICGSLVTQSTENGRSIVKLSHATVKDYLMSDHFRRGAFRKLMVDPNRIHQYMCTICLVYLKAHNDVNRAQAREHQARHALIDYAARFWTEHFRSATHKAKLPELARDLIFDRSFHFARWAQFGAFLPENHFHVETTSKDLDNLQTRLNTSLYYAAFTGSLDLISALLGAGANVNGNYGVFGTPLAAATIKDDVEVVRYLLKVGASVDSEAGPYGYVLHTAAYFGFPDMVGLLLSHGANVHIQGGLVQTALYAATCSENKRHTKSITARLLQAGADVKGGRAPSDTPLSNAAFSGDEATASLLIEAKADLDDGSLHSALRNGQIKMAQMLIASGASVDAINPNMGTTFRAATMYGKSALEFLAKTIEANVHMVDGEGMTALHVAASKNRVVEAQYLLELGLQVDTKDKKGWSAIHHAASANNTDCLELLLPFWTLDMNGWTPLHLACRQNQPKALDLLLLSGLKATPVTTRDPERSWTLRDIAKWHENYNLLSPGGHALHSALGEEQTISDEDYEKNVVQSERLWRFCDGCQPGQVSIA